MDVASVKSQSMTSQDEIRKSAIRATAKDIIKSPYNKVNVKDIDFHPKPRKTRIKGFPTEIDINTFLRQLTFRKLSTLSAKFMSKVTTSLRDTISYNSYWKVMNEVFNPTPADSLKELLYKRFKPLKFTEDGRDLDIENQDMVVIDLMIALALLSRSISKYNDKLRLIFNFWDDDGDHCMRADEILFMIQRLERIFCKECAQINLESHLLLQSIADKRAETKFHYIIQVIRRKADQGKVDEGDELITYGEFYEAIRSKPEFYKRILPRTLNIEDVLLCNKTEEVYYISDFSYDDFVQFRYEMNTIFKKTHFQGKYDENSLNFGTSPLSKIGGLFIKDLPPQEKKKELELYRPPGIVKKVVYSKKLREETQLNENIWNAVPSSKIYVRMPAKNDDSHHQTLEEKVRVNVVQKPVSEIADYLDLFDTDFPMEYNEIANASREDREGMEKERDIREMIRKNDKRYKEVKNLLPKDNAIRDMMKNKY